MKPITAKQQFKHAMSMHRLAKRIAFEIGENAYTEAQNVKPVLISGRLLYLQNWCYWYYVASKMPVSVKCAIYLRNNNQLK